MTLIQSNLSNPDANQPSGETPKYLTKRTAQLFLINISSIPVAISIKNDLQEIIAINPIT